ncbi:MAG: bifunctional serine/threonine-protein kinase/formylglycine-generating enzyme family protein [Planctomycetota bacterium]
MRHTWTIVGYDSDEPDLPPEVHFGSPEDRYRIEGFVGEGGMGEVFQGRDALMRRQIAVKYLRAGHVSNAAAVRQFWTEVVHAGLLDHPCVPPVHDVGIDDRGRPFYVMRLIKGRSLRQVLEDNEASDPEATDSEWGLPRFLSTFVQVCGAIQFAHDSEILHLDIKPDNVMVGEYGDVYVVDWGLSEPATSSPQRAARGTPSYMAPEQTRSGQALTAAADVFALGALLYELCLRRRAFPGKSTTEVFTRIRAGDFERGDPWERCPASLREVIQQALSTDPDQRTSSAGEVAKQVRSFLDGRRDRQRRRQRAHRELAEAQEELRRAGDQREHAQSMQRELELRRPEPWASADEKAAFWDQEDDHDRIVRASQMHLDRAVQHLLRAREDAPDDMLIRRALADIYTERFAEAERHGDRFQLHFLEMQLRRLELPEVDQFLEGRGRIEIACDRPPSQLSLHHVVERRRVLSVGERIELPLDNLTLPSATPGRYQVEVEVPGRRAVRAPLRVTRGESVRLELRSRTEAEIGEEFVQIPAGPFVMGGDELTFKSHPRTVVEVDEFAIGRFPITWEEYRVYLQALADESLSNAEENLPRLPSADDAWVIKDGQVLYGDIRQDWPIFSVTFDQAQAYCRWRSTRDGRTYRLPTDAEWEKAARGVDERIYPWGDRFDPTFCKNADSTPEKSQPEPVGEYPTDRSPYGVQDMAGGIREWCNSWFSEKDSLRLVRGGSWNFSSIGAHCAYRLGCAPNLAYPFIGFRLAHDFGEHQADQDASK